MRFNWRRFLVVLAAVLVGAGGVFWWEHARVPRPPESDGGLLVRFEGLPDAWQGAPVSILVDDVGAGKVWLTYSRTIRGGAVRVPVPPPGRYTLGHIAGAGSPLPALHAEFVVEEGRAAGPVVLRVNRSSE